MESIFLFGPFIGSLSWEFYRFVPYMIYLKKIHPKYKFAVLTREERFDLYGEHSNYFIPLKIEHDDIKKQIYFTLKDYNINNYKILIKRLQLTYKDRFIIEGHCFPDISEYRYKIRWQFPRSKMIYDFKPRIENYNVITKYFKKKCILFTPPYNIEFIKNIENIIIKNKLNKEYDFVTFDNLNLEIFKNIYDLEINNNVSYLGYIIEIIKKSKFIIGPKSDFTHLSLLLKKEIYCWGNKTNIDKINPLNTKINIYNDISEFNNNFDLLNKLKIKNNLDKFII